MTDSHTLVLFFDLQRRAEVLRLFGPSLCMIFLCSLAFADSASFRTIYTPSTGLGRAYNGSSCADCHRSPIFGGSSQVNITRAGHRDNSGRFVPVPNGGILHTHFTDERYTERHDPADSIEGQRVTINLLGDGYIEAVEDKELLKIAAEQRKLTAGRICGQVVYAPILEAPGKTAVGRFGWKSQHASLLSSAADALRSELGISSRLYPLMEGTTGDKHFNNAGVIDGLAAFIRQTEYPSRDQALAASAPAQTGSQIFGRIGCGICHVGTLTTALAGTIINAGTYTVPERLGGKAIHPYSDFLLHDVGTGDGIVQSATPEYADQSAANKFRTAPLWGLRFRSWMMHDGKSVTYHQAIMHHAGEAAEVIEKYQRLAPEEKHQLWEFLNLL